MLWKLPNDIKKKLGVGGDALCTRCFEQRIIKFTPIQENKVIMNQYLCIGCCAYKRHYIV